MGDAGRDCCAGVLGCDLALELMGIAEGAGCAGALVSSRGGDKRELDRSIPLREWAHPQPGL